MSNANRPAFGPNALAWLLLGLSVLGALTYGAFARDWALHEASPAARAALKASGVALLAIIAWRQRSSALLIAALALGALGDALLALGSGMWFVAGGAAFFVGHICYVLLFLGAGLGIGAALKQPLRVAAIAAVALLALACLVALWPGDDPSAWAPTVLYTLALTAMACATLTLPWARWLVMVGGLLFFSSDVLLTWQTNKPPSDPNVLRVASDASWFTYYFGQLGLCLGALSLRARA